MSRTFGALPPPGCEWLLGKTAFVIKGVRDIDAAVAFLEKASEFDPSLVPIIAGLRSLSDGLKNGSLVLTDTGSVDLAK